MFAENLKKLRKEKGLSQEEMAAKLNVVDRTYGSWERNEREPDFSTLCKIADFFNVSTDYILGRVPMNIEVKKETPPDLPEGMRDIQLVIPDNASPEQLDAKFEQPFGGLFVRNCTSRMTNRKYGCFPLSLCVYSDAVVHFGTCLSILQSGKM